MFHLGYTAAGTSQLFITATSPHSHWLTDNHYVLTETKHTASFTPVLSACRMKS